MLSAILAAICLPFWGRRSAIVIDLVAASHWVLDLIVHRSDMPVLPANLGRLPRLGFGLCCGPAEAVARELYRDCNLYLDRKYDIAKRLLDLQQ